MFEELTYWDVIWPVLKIPYLLIIIFFALTVHELGHLVAARMLGISVDSVKIGRGRLLYRRHDRSATLWSFHLIPLGAHVKISEPVFAARPFWQRFLTIIAAPLANFVLPLLLFFVFYMVAGQPSSPPILAGVQPGLAADQAGLQPGDRILSIDGNTIRNGRDVWRATYEHKREQQSYAVDRNGQVLTLNVRPGWVSYVDDKGINRAHPRLGVYWWHKPTELKAVLEVNGKSVEGDIDGARAALKQGWDQNNLIVLRGPEDKPLSYYMILRAANNTHFVDPENKNYEKVFFGQEKGNFYLHQSAGAQFYDAARYTAEKIGKLALLPFQLFPFDPYTIGDEYAVIGEETKGKNYAYDFIHKLSIASIFIGLINLLPFPYLDGGHIAIQGIERVRRAPLSRKAKARFFGLTFALFYFSALIANMDNLPRYIDSRVKKLQESLYSEQTESSAPHAEQ